MVKFSDLKEFDPADFLETTNDRASFSAATFEDGDPLSSVWHSEPSRDPWE